MDIRIKEVMCNLKNYSFDVLGAYRMDKREAQKLLDGLEENHFSGSERWIPIEYDGYADGTKTRSGLFFDALRIIEHTQPKVAIAENVKNLASKKFSKQFSIVLDSLEDAGYNNYWKILNAKDYEIPQNRERIIIVSIRKDIDSGAFDFPEPVELKNILLDVLEDEVDEKYYVDPSKVKALIPQLEKKEISNTVRASGGGSFDRHQWDLVAIRGD